MIGSFNMNITICQHLICLPKVMTYYVHVTWSGPLRDFTDDYDDDDDDEPPIFTFNLLLYLILFSLSVFFIFDSLYFNSLFVDRL